MKRIALLVVQTFLCLMSALTRRIKQAGIDPVAEEKIVFVRMYWLLVNKEQPSESREAIESTGSTLRCLCCVV
jgi:hypothetical protein